MKDDNSQPEDLEDILSRGKRSVVLQEQLRKKQTGEDKRKQHQRELAESLNRQAQERLAQAKEKPSEQKWVCLFFLFISIFILTMTFYLRMKKSNISYRNPGSMPNEDEVKQLKIYVDKKQETVILPIFGIPTPFHISMIKVKADNRSHILLGIIATRLSLFRISASLLKVISLTSVLTSFTRVPLWSKKPRQVSLRTIKQHS